MRGAVLHLKVLFDDAEHPTNGISTARRGNEIMLDGNASLVEMRP